MQSRGRWIAVITAFGTLLGGVAAVVAIFVSRTDEPDGGGSSGGGTGSEPVPGTPYADVAWIESTIEKEYEEEAGDSIAAECPSTVKWEVGGTFPCYLTFADGTGSRSTVTVTMYDDEGTFDWEWPPSE